MTRESIVLGVGTAAVGLMGFARREWLLAETPKGRFLVEALGLGGARLFHGAACSVLVVFGALLASGLLQPVRWAN